MRKFALSIVFASGFALLAGCSHDHGHHDSGHHDNGHNHDHNDTQDTDTQKDKKTHQNIIKYTL